MKIVITAMGAVTPIGADCASFEEGLRSGRNGAAPLRAFSTEGLRNTLVCEVTEETPPPTSDRRDARRIDRASLLFLRALAEAIGEACDPFAGVDRSRVGIAIGSTLGGMVSGTAYYRSLLTHGKICADRLLDYPLYSPGTRAAVTYGLHGPILAISTACSSANVALGQAADMLRLGEVDMMIVGGVDTMAEITCAGFGVLRNVSPDICRPFDRNRNGLILGEGAACLVLETADSAARGGRTPLAEFAGYGMSADAYHMTAPDVTGRGPASAMRQAVEDADASLAEVGYINAHGTGTAHNDRAETAAIKKLFGERAGAIPVSSSKSMFGHTLGASGAIEAVTVILAMRGGFIPPTINYQTPDRELDLDYVPNTARTAKFDFALSNNFGFGGNNCAISLRRWHG